MQNEIELTSSDWLLIFLKLCNKREIKGKLLFVKLLFLTDKQILEGKLDKTFFFFPYLNGPYSRVFEDCSVTLEKQGFIIKKKVENKGYTSYLYQLTDAGDEYIKLKRDQINKIIIEKLEKLKNYFLDRGYREMLRYVYLKYPEYTTASKIKEIVLNNNAVIEQNGSYY